MEEEKIVFCKSGGCTAKLGAGVLEHILEKLPKGEKDPNLLVGYDSKDDASVYRLTDDLAMVQTLDFFPPVVEDPYTFGKIAATNALSDIYAMGGEVRTALNIVCFPEQMDGLNFLEQVEAGCITDYDGNLSNVFVDGYDSNLGLICGGFGQGQFCVTGDTFREFCMNHDIKVNWANK